MIRRDHVLRMIEEFVRALARINSLKRGQRWNEAGEALDDEFKRLIGDGAQAVARLSETDLVARLAQEGPTQLVREKTLLLTALLKEAGDVAMAENRSAEGCECYLKALHLLLDVLGREDVVEFPEFVPKVESLKQTLEGTSLPMRTHAMLMQHYERIGEFAKAEDELFAMLEAEPGNERLLEFGCAFYRRLLAQSDTALTNANLPRGEVEEGLKKLEAWGK
jgi:uncharacterized protein YuzB (UPF0349 family)